MLLHLTEKMTKSNCKFFTIGTIRNDHPSDDVVAENVGIGFRDTNASSSAPNANVTNMNPLPMECEQFHFVEPVAAPVTISPNDPLKVIPENGIQNASIFL